MERTTPRGCGFAACDVISTLLSLMMLGVIVTGITLLLLPLFAFCALLWVLEKLRVFRLAAPVRPSQFRSKILLLKRPDVDMYIDTLSANQVSTAVEEWLITSASGDMLKSGLVMISDEALQEELEEHVDGPESTFFKVLYCYPPPKAFRYHMAVALTYKEETDMQTLALEELIERLKALEFDVAVYDTAETIEMSHEDRDNVVPKTTLSFGSSTIWSNTAAQRLFSWEIKTLLKGFVRLQERITWWTPADVKAEEIADERVRFSWFSHESHGSIEEMKFNNWLHRLRCGDIFFLLFAGFTTILYSGLRKNPVLGEDTNRFKDLRPKFGSLLAAILRFYCSMFASRTGSSNCAMIYTVKALR